VALLEGGKTREVICLGSTDAEGERPALERVVKERLKIMSQ